VVYGAVSLAAAAANDSLYPDRKMRLVEARKFMDHLKKTDPKVQISLAKNPNLKVPFSPSGGW